MTLDNTRLKTVSAKGGASRGATNLDPLTALVIVLLSISFLAFLIFASYIGYHVYGPGHTKFIADNKDVFSLIEPFIVLMGFLATVLQLRLTQTQSQKQTAMAQEQNNRNEEWRKTEFITDQLQMFSKDRAVVNVKRMLEAIDATYDARIRLDVVDPHNPHSDKDGEAKEIEVRVDKQTLMNAFTPDPGPYHDVHTGKLMPGKKLTPLENKIAYELDGFLGYLVGFRKFISDGIISSEDLRPYLYYWLSLIVEPQDEAADNSDTARQAARVRARLHDYLRGYYNATPGRRHEGECYFIAQTLGLDYTKTPFYIEDTSHE